MLISNDYYPALDQDHVDLVTSGIARKGTTVAGFPNLFQIVAPNTTLWPRTTYELRSLLSESDLDAHVVAARQDNPLKTKEHAA